MFRYEMFGRLTLLLFLYLIEHTVNPYDDDQSQQNGCVCGGDPSLLSNSGEAREKRQVTSASDLINEINNLLGNNSTLANLTSAVLANLTAANLTQILDEVSTATNQTNTTQPLTSTVPLNTTTTTSTPSPTTIPTTQTSTR
jgi:hypothetical protein